MRYAAAASPDLPLVLEACGVGEQAANLVEVARALQTALRLRVIRLQLERERELPLGLGRGALLERRVTRRQCRAQDPAAAASVAARSGITRFSSASATSYSPSAKRLFAESNPLRARSNASPPQSAAARATSLSSRCRVPGSSRSNSSFASASFRRSRSFCSRASAFVASSVGLLLRSRRHSGRRWRYQPRQDEEHERRTQQQDRERGGDEAASEVLVRACAERSSPVVRRQRGSIGAGASCGGRSAARGTAAAGAAAPVVSSAAARARRAPRSCHAAAPPATARDRRAPAAASAAGTGTRARYRRRWRAARPRSGGVGVMRRVARQQLVGQRAKAIDIVGDRRRLAVVLLRAGAER